MAMHIHPGDDLASGRIPRKRRWQENGQSALQASVRLWAGAHLKYGSKDLVGLPRVEFVLPEIEFGQTLDLALKERTLWAASPKGHEMPRH